MNQEIDYQEAVAEILENARQAFRTHAEQEAIAERERQKAEAKRIGRERAAVREWLASWMPVPLVQFVKLHDSTYNNAEYYNYESDAAGIWVQFDIPGAVPIAFKLHRQGDELGFGRWPYDRYNENRFTLPTFAQVKCDEDDEPFVKYDWPNSPQYLDFEVALGHAIHLYEEWWPALSEKLDRAYEVQVVAQEPVENEPVDVQERIALALERLASATEARVYGY